MAKLHFRVKTTLNGHKLKKKVFLRYMFVYNFRNMQENAVLNALDRNTNFDECI